MPLVSMATLKAYFESGKVPTESNYIDLIDSTYPASHTHPGSDITSAVAEAVNADTVDNKHAIDFHQVANDIINSNDGRFGGGLTVGSTLDYAVTGEIVYLNGLVSRKGGVNHNVYAPKFLDPYINAETYDAYVTSSFSKTAFSIATEFDGCPSQAQALILAISVKDTGSSSNACLVCIGSNNTANEGAIVRCSGIADGHWVTGFAIAKTNGLGTAYIQGQASGTDTLTISLRLYGYCL